MHVINQQMMDDIQLSNRICNMRKIFQSVAHHINNECRMKFGYSLYHAFSKYELFATYGNGYFLSRYGFIISFKKDTRMTLES